ncbi:MAG: T9SS type A sorting domain-containing protein [Bacteroidetes bacterium]|nr:T9SS type A sorting domain-containing protein [Bacteroidota bacterium]
MGTLNYNVTRRRGLAMAALLTVVFLGFGLQAQAQTQLPLPSYGSTYTSTQIRGYWFQAPTDFTIVGVRVPTDIGTTAQNVQIIKFAAGPPPVYATSTSAHTTLGLWTNVNTTTIIPCNINIVSGDYIAIFGTRTNGGSMNNSYATPAGPYTSSVLGYPMTLTRMVYQAGTFPVQAVSQEVSGSIARTEVYYTATVTGPNDAGISSIDSPLNFCAGVQDVKVTLRNYGNNRLNSATINWKLNNVAQTPYSWTGMLDTNDIASRQTQVTLATQNFASGIPYTIEAWTSMPNGVTDTITSNDSSSVLTQAAISGTFTIGGASPDFPNIAAAVNAINQFGLCGPAVFNIRSGTYNEQFSLDALPGSSSVNTVTFQSETGNRGDVNITSGAATSTTNNYVVQLMGADYVTFRNVTFTATNTTYGTVLDIQGGSEYNTFENVDFMGVQTTSTSSYMTVIWSPSGSIDNYNTLLGCNIRNGSFGMYMYGGGTTSTENGFHVEGCEFTGAYYYPIYFYYMGEIEFFNNRVVKDSGYPYMYSMLMYYGFNSKIERNTFITDGGTYGYGFMIYYDNYYQTGTSRIVNNFFTSRNSNPYAYYAARVYYCNDILFAHNTLYMDGTYASGYTLYSYYGANQRYFNNIIINTGVGRAWYVPSPAAISASDYNDIVAAGSVLAYWGGDRANLLALQTASGMDAASVSKDVTFYDYTAGDLHLAAPSDDDNDLIGTILSEVTDDIDNDPRVRPYMGADEACYLIPNSLQYEFVDGGGQPIGYAEIPGTVGVHYTVIFPDFDATIQMTANFYSVPGNQLMYTQSFSANKPQGQTLDGTSYFNIPSNLPVGFYRIELVFNTKNSCGYYRDYMPYPTSLMLIGQGSTPCEVWPGDVNNDGLVNYTDRKDLNLYIYDANLNTLWLNGPARYRADAALNPLTYLMWQPQASVPWYTTMGCYMDADGNGVVNNFDYIAIKLNWNRSHGAIAPKHDDQFQPMSFDMTQNYPNPFNPTTQIKYSVPERTQVQLRIVDMLGREIAMPVNGIVETGVYQVEFDGSSLQSGQYLAIVSMTGQETGLGFNKTVKMVLNK